MFAHYKLEPHSQSMKLRYFLLFLIICLVACAKGADQKTSSDKSIVTTSDSINNVIEDTIQFIEERSEYKTADDIKIVKDLKYDKYTLEDVYPYKDTTRVFQWNKIAEHLAHLENMQQNKNNWAILSNYKNQNREAPLVYSFVRNEYKRVSDTLDVERYQGTPLYLIGDSVKPTRYGRDGWLVHLLSPDTLNMVKIEGVSFDGQYEVPRSYIIPWGDTIVLNKVVVVDVKNQNISTLEKTDTAWVVRSMNPATTGVHRPPYAHETPVGLFAIQQKKNKMLYTHDGSQELAGYAPYANRFTNGAYIHGVPTSSVNAPIIEYSWSLGTTPRSHMCVRNTSSHAKFIYDWAKIKESVVLVID